MLEAYSAGYYVGRVAVEPADGPHAVMEPDQHRQAVSTVYATGEGVERLDWPLVVKLGGLHLPVFSDEDVGARTLAVPDAVFEATTVDSSPTEVLVAKADLAAQLLEWYTPYTVPESAMA